MIILQHAFVADVSIANALFYAFTAMILCAALVVVISQNIVHMAVGLLFALLGITGIYFLLDAEFLAAVQIVIYVGGTLILIIFGVMLTSQTARGRFIPSLPQLVIALTLGAILMVTLIAAIHQVVPTLPQSKAPAGEYPMDTLGQALLGDALAPFELISVLLLVAMIGAAYLARGRKGDREDHKGEIP
jgi:NADH-quinone oxidoreductase subunit J